ncbi:MAG: hypothetical protein AAGK97_19115, partial [Bacteroidota bacterium]
PISINGVVYTTDTNLNDTFPAPSGCDSLIEIDITFLDYQRRDLDTTLCPGQSVLVNGVTYSTNTNISDTFPAPMGCDSIVNIMIVAEDYLRRDLDTTLCPGESVTVNGVVYSSNTNLSDTFPSPAGCDSIVNIMIIATDFQRRMIDTTLCPGESITVNGVVYNMATNTSDTFPAPMGCDSIVDIMITMDDYQR